MLKGFEKLIRKEGKTQREAFLNQEDLFEDLNLFSGKLKYNFSHEQGTLSHCFLNELDHLDEKYPFFLETGPRDQNFPREFNENQFENMDFDEILGKIQTLTDFIVKNLKGFCLKLEEIKKELLISQLLKRKREEELENWGLCLSFSLKSMIEKEKINQKLTIPQISPLELEQKTFEYHRGLIKEYEALLNRNSFYTDFDYFKEKIEAIKNKDFSHKIRDFSLMQSLKTLQKYSSNRVIRPNSPKETSNKSPDLKNSNFSPHRLESKFQFEDFEKKELELSLLDKKKKRKVQIPSKNKSSLKKNDPLISSPNELIKEIFKNEENYLRLDENKNNKIALDLSKIPPFQTSLPPKITINLNELSEIKKIKRQTTENLEKNIEETPKSMNLPYEEESKKESSNPVTPKLLIKLESPIENQEKDSFERNSQSIKSPPQKFLEDETFNEMKKITSTSPQNKDSLLMDPLAMKNSNDSSESLNLKKTKNIRNNTIKSISDKKIVLTRYNTLQSKGKESTNLNLGVMSPKSRFEDIRDKKKSEINNEESLLKFLDNKLEDF